MTYFTEIDFKTFQPKKLTVSLLPSKHAHSLKAQPEGGVQNFIYYNPEFGTDFFFFFKSLNGKKQISQFLFKLELEVTNPKDRKTQQMHRRHSCILTACKNHICDSK